MNIETHDVSDLRPAPYNPRIKLKPGDPAWEKLARSLDEFELVQPIVWNKRTGHVVSGHQRLTVLKHQGVTHVECVVVDLSLEKEKALNVTLNNVQVASGWDAERLVDLVAELQDLPDFDATLTGFDEQQLRDILLTPVWNDTATTDQPHPVGNATVRAIFEVPQEIWESTEALLDQILQHDSRIRLHVSH